MLSLNASTDVFKSSLLTIGRFRCPPGHRLWNAENRADGPPTVVFPRVPVRINQAGRRSVVADANCVMFYNSGQAYTRALLTNRGDECEYFSVSPGVLTAIAEEFDPSVGDRPLAPFRFPNGPTDAVSYLRQRRLFQYVASIDSADKLLVQEEFFDILRGVFATAFRTRNSIAHSRSPATLRAHADAAETTKEVLGRFYHDRLLLEDIAESVHVSPYHLCRIFRTHTGYSLHAYIEHLRLRQALESLADRSIDLTTLAFDLGYSSHAHFTRAFRRLYGLTPSAARDHGSLNRLRQKQARL